MNIRDEWDGIDKNIEPLVITLNKLQIPTSGSCEGHVDRGYPSPWVEIRPEDNDPKKVAELREKVKSLLEQFYLQRQTSPEIKITILDGSGGFTIHSMNGHFISWRSMINSRAAERSGNLSGKEISDLIVNEDERAMRKIILPSLQAEFAQFAEFLKHSKK